MGPRAVQEIWNAPLAKWRDRLRMIAAAGAPPPLALRSRDLFASSVLQYWAQLQTPPPIRRREETLWLNRILRFPLGTVTGAFMARVQELGVQSCRNVLAWGLSASVRQWSGRRL